MSSLRVQLTGALQPASDQGAQVSPGEFATLVRTARGAASESGSQLSVDELRTLFLAVRSAREVSHAAGKLGLSIDDLRGIRDAMMSDGALSRDELFLLFEAASAPKDHNEAGASVSRDEADLFSGLDRNQMDTATRRLMDEQVAPRLTAMLDGPARKAGVAVRSPVTQSLAPIMPTGPRNAIAAEMVKSQWLDPDNDTGFGSSTARICPANFEIEGTTPSASWWNDGVRRGGSWQRGDTGTAKITKMPADGILHFTMLIHPSGHLDSEGDETWQRSQTLAGNTNSWGFARDNNYNLQIMIPGRGTYTMHHIRNAPLGESDLGLFKARGGEEYVTAQDISIDTRGLPSGTRIRVAMWPSPSGRVSAPDTSSFGYSTNRIFDLVLP